MRRYLVLTDQEIKELLIGGTVIAMFEDKIPIHIMNEEAYDHEGMCKFDDGVEKAHGGW